MKKKAGQPQTRKEKAEALGVVVRRASAGLGLFTTIPRKRGEYIIEYTGDRLTDAEADRRGGRYLFTLEKDLVIDGSGRENLARYINHSCKPNCDAEHDEEKREMHIRARRAIAPGEELTYNYGKEFFNDYIKPFGCRCAHCMGKGK